MDIMKIFILPTLVTVNFESMNFKDHLCVFNIKVLNSWSTQYSSADYWNSTKVNHTIQILTLKL